MMKFYVITLFPEMIEQSCAFGILGRAIKRGLVSVECFNPRDFTQDRHRTVDDRPYGVGPGMLMKWQPLADAIEAAKAQATDAAKVIYMSPQGSVLKQQTIQRFVANDEISESSTNKGSGVSKDLILIAGRYEGIDERLIDKLVDEEWSIGDYVLSGGELAAMVVIDGITRMCPGVLGDEESAHQDSFMSGLLDYPHYTRPEEIDGDKVPQVLLSGDHKAISQWRLQQAIGRTWLRRPDLIGELKAAKSGWDNNKEKLLAEFIQAHEKK